MQPTRALFTHFCLRDANVSIQRDSTSVALIHCVKHLLHVWGMPFLQSPRTSLALFLCWPISREACRGGPGEDLEGGEVVTHACIPVIDEMNG